MELIPSSERDKMPEIRFCAIQGLGAWGESGEAILIFE